MEYSWRKKLPTYMYTYPCFPSYHVQFVCVRLYVCVRIVWLCVSFPYPYFLFSKWSYHVQCVCVCDCVCFPVSKFFSFCLQGWRKLVHAWSCNWWRSRKDWQEGQSCTTLLSPKRPKNRPVSGPWLKRKGTAMLCVKIYRRADSAKRGRWGIN